MDMGQLSEKGKIEKKKKQIVTKQDMYKVYLIRSTTKENANIMFISTVTLTSDADVALNKLSASQGSLSVFESFMTRFTVAGCPKKK